MSGLPGMPGGSCGFSRNETIRSCSSTCITPNAIASMRGTSRQPTVTSAPLRHVLLEHDLVVHLVDMVAGQHDDVVDAVILQDVDVLVDRVGGALVPLGLRDALARRQDVEALVALGAQEVPAALQVADQAVRLVLGRDADAADARVERVGEREVDDPGLAAEIDRGLGAAVGQLLQPRAAAAGEHERERVAAEPARRRRLRHGRPPSMIRARVSVSCGAACKLRPTPRSAGR